MVTRRTSLIAARKTAGFTQEKLADALGVARTTVQRWELGESSPLPYLRPKLAAILGVSAQQLGSWLDDHSVRAMRVAQPTGVLTMNTVVEAAQFPANGQGADQRRIALQNVYPELSVDRIAVVSGSLRSSRVEATVGASPSYLEGGDDVERQVFLRVLAGSVAGMAFADPLGEFAARAVSGGRLLGQGDVDQVLGLARAFADQDHQYGGQLSVRAVVTQLATTAELTDSSFGSSRVRGGWFAAVADLADTAGGVCFDAGLHSQAERAFRFSVGCATEAGDWDMRAKALTGLANLSVHLGREDDALSFAEEALVRADRLTPMVGAVVHTRHARALGLLGGARSVDCRSAVARAEDLFAAAAPGDEPAWLAYYDQAHLERDAGRAMVYLAFNGGDHEEARHRLEGSIARFPAGFSRGKALAKANLAALVMTCGDPREAVALGEDALAAVGVVRSDRVNDALKQLSQASREHATFTDARDLAERVERTLQAQAV
ncbi:transcriptional regulator with XRE-family HTH domain [Actinokineospora baliensis]|uniref:helix-turn-helix transcriptional regulator n=1 Tax=Actinokineospora baliensis TaxID=547056 RepID=UPI001958591A|nr:helix-turn-helix transcriptional regulator [Actinokineospora baliensis]MBM7774272.1 transcriptional regulator with XRE-family HTH domain [Actinokineospora baliensis]